VFTRSSASPAGKEYFFPGVSGPELINISRWVGALITGAEMIGTRGGHPGPSPHQRSGELIPARRLGLCLVVVSGTNTLHGLDGAGYSISRVDQCGRYHGDYRSARRAAAGYRVGCREDEVAAG
jgi:hypothetical protein